MNPPGGPDWVWWLTAAVLGTAAVGLGAWSLLWDRSRRGGRVRLRCPKCWYDVAGVPRGVDERGREGLRCPECGRFTRRERGLKNELEGGCTGSILGLFSGWCGCRAAWMPTRGTTGIGVEVAKGMSNRAEARTGWVSKRGIGIVMACVTVVMLTVGAGVVRAQPGEKVPAFDEPRVFTTGSFHRPYGIASADCNSSAVFHGLTRTGSDLRP
ncbi:MAG TPA: hypothetical protein PLU35_12125, partial [Phycisphaerales bacterium]|nr:hypothetical protein [Phycisphaerales bacterium]